MKKEKEEKKDKEGGRERGGRKKGREKESGRERGRKGGRKEQCYKSNETISERNLLTRNYSVPFFHLFLKGYCLQM